MGCRPFVLAGTKVAAQAHELRGNPPTGEERTMTDRELQDHVQNALGWEPSIDETDIGVSVDAGIVTLRGDVKSHAERATAERVALHVYGVKAVANDIEVRLHDEQRRTDTDIA